MDCPSCQRENPDAARFCMHCAAPLLPACTGCGAELPAAARFCPQCAHPVEAAAPTPPELDPRDYTPKHLADRILQSKSALEGERKQVSVLFADVKGSMELAESLDPEEWHAILDRFFQILAEGMHRFEGTVNQYTGDGIMALFGAPLAHEDHAQRACYAALHLRDELRRYADELRGSLGLNFSVRIGINSGEVVVGKIGDDLRMDYTAQGHSVGLAARLQQLAEPGTILLSQQTAALVEGYFELEDLGETRLKGVTGPVRTHRLRATGALRTRLDVSRARGFSRFVGRLDEMATLEAALEHAQEGHGQVVGVVAEAGAGKSRLCFEFLERCRARGVRIHEIRGVAHGAGIPYLPIRELFRQYYDVTDRDPPERAREKIAGRLLLLDDSLREVLPTVFDFLGIADPGQPTPHLDPRARLQQLYAMARRVTLAARRHAAVVTLVEDLHWLDGASLEFLAQMVDAAPRGRVMYLLNFRPEFAAPWMQRSSYQQLPLRPLGREEIRELIGDLLGSDASLRDLARLVEERTGGNPFFIEEVVQSLAESGALAGERGAYQLTRPVDTVRVPNTVNALLAARIDRLAEREKRVLQMAAVLGPEFGEPTLAAAGAWPANELAEALRTLCDAEFIYPQALYPVAEYAFKHPLTTQVAYESQLGEIRARAHAAVAQAIEKLHADVLDEQSAVLAHHWEGAGETLPAARWHARAARREGAVGAAEADRHWRRVRALLADENSTEETARLGSTACLQILNLSWRLRIDEEEAAVIFTEGTSLAERCGDRKTLISLHTVHGALWNTLGQLEKSLRSIEPVVGMAEELGDPALLADVRLAHASALEQSGRLTRAKALSERIIEEAPAEAGSFWGFDTRLYAQTLHAYQRSLLGELAEGGRELARLGPLANERGELEALFNVIQYRAHCAWLAGDARTSEACTQEMLGLNERLEHPLYRTYFADVIAIAHILTGRFDEAAATVAQAPVSGLGVANPIHPWLLAEAPLLAGDAAEAARAASEAIEGPLQERPYFKLMAQLVLARALISIDVHARAAEIDAALGAAQELLITCSAGSLAPRLAEARAERANALGDEPARLEHLREAHRLYTEVGATGHAERVARELGL